MQGSRDIYTETGEYKIYSHMGFKNLMLISATIQKLQQCKYVGSPPPFPAYVVQIPLPVRGLKDDEYSKDG